MNYADLGEKIRSLRKKNKMTQAALARATGISAPYLGLIERGQRIASLETFVRICNALQAEPGDLLAGSLEQAKNPPADALQKISNYLDKARKIIEQEIAKRTQ